jgi:peptidyl-prolyl cis-trans isomerase B (cyclophilin B)
VHAKGALAAARQPDQVNPERRSSGSQFYLVHGKTFDAADLGQVAARNARYGTPVNYNEEQKQTYATKGGAPHLDGAYTVFGEVVEGLDVLDALARVPCDGRDRPLTDVRFFMRILE